jgi:hypothetical protein
MPLLGTFAGASTRAYGQRASSRKGAPTSVTYLVIAGGGAGGTSNGTAGFYSGGGGGGVYRT